MERHIVEILVILMREFPGGIVTPEEFEPLTNDLIGRGYTQDEIETALFWFQNLQENREEQSRVGEYLAGSFRILHEFERMIFSPRAFGYLIELHTLDLISLAELNAILDKALTLGERRIDLEEIKMLATMQILEREKSTPIVGHSYIIKKTSNLVQ